MCSRYGDSLSDIAAESRDIGLQSADANEGPDEMRAGGWASDGTTFYQPQQLPGEGRCHVTGADVMYASLHGTSSTELTGRCVLHVRGWPCVLCYCIIC